jgi:hypothetical protein
MVDGVPLAKAFRHREIMLLQAVAEKYGKVSLIMGGNIWCCGYIFIKSRSGSRLF